MKLNSLLTYQICFVINLFSVIRYNRLAMRQMSGRECHIPGNAAIIDLKVLNVDFSISSFACQHIPVDYFWTSNLDLGGSCVVFERLKLDIVSFDWLQFEVFLEVFDEWIISCIQTIIQITPNATTALPWSFLIYDGGSPENEFIPRF